MGIHLREPRTRAGLEGAFPSPLPRLPRNSNRNTFPPGSPAKKARRWASNTEAAPRKRYMWKGRRVCVCVAATPPPLSKAYRGILTLHCGLLTPTTDSQLPPRGNQTSPPPHHPRSLKALPLAGLGETRLPHSMYKYPIRRGAGGLEAIGASL